MKINRDNYEAYFLDYHEGQLGPEMVSELMLFVELNPDLKSLLDDFELITLEPSSHVVFGQKSQIKKNVLSSTESINELNCDIWFVSEAEGLLTPEQIGFIDSFVAQNPVFEKDRLLYKATKLSADDNIIFAKKDQLRQNETLLITSNNYDNYLVRELENDLSVSEKRMLSAFLASNPQFEKERKLYQHTILSADNSIVFPSKSMLRQKAFIPLRKIVYYSLSAAASLLLLFGTYFALNTAGKKDPSTDTNNPVTAQATQVQPKTKINTQPVVQPDNIVKVINNEADRAIDPIPVINIETSSRLAEVNPVLTLQARTQQPITSKNLVDPQFLFIRSSQMYINQSRELYYNIKLEQHLAYAELNATDRNPGRTLLATLTRKTGKYIEINRDNQRNIAGSNASFWTLAELGVQTLNTVTSSQLELNLRKDDEGKVIGYNLESGILDIEKDIKH